ncbi:hypothetical protein [Pseudoxanthomonas wuyuanensis]
MTIKVPTNLEQALLAIAELQVRAEWLQGQSNLLLGFVTSSPKNLEAFANFSTLIAADTNPLNQEMRAVAQRALADGLAKHVSAQPPDPPASPSPVGNGSNVIQFPSRP